MNNKILFTYPFIEGGREIFDPPNESDNFKEYYSQLFDNYIDTFPRLFFSIIKLVNTTRIGHTQSLSPKELTNTFKPTIQLSQMKTPSFR